MKILFVCPFAHHPGHPPRAAISEPVALQDAGHKVALVTFQGIMDNVKAEVLEYKIIGENNKLHDLFARIRKWTPSRWVLMLFETASTINRAVKILRKDKYDFIYLRDGEPFLFVHHLLTIVHKRLNIIVSLTAALVYTPEMPEFSLRQLPLIIYILILQYVINTKLWRFIYALNLKRNNFMYVVQNPIAEKGYSQYLEKVFDGKVKCVRLGMKRVEIDSLVNKEIARDYFDIPQDVFLLLSFGAPHSGKNLEVVFQALSELPDVWLLHGGLQAYSLGSNPRYLSEKYNLKSRVVIQDYYIPDEEKPFYFAASDAIVLSYTPVFNSTASMLYETAQYELPVIASKNGEIPELVLEYGLGLLFDTSDKDSLKWAITNYKMLMNYKSNKELFKNGCKQFSEEYSIANWANNLVKVYEEMK